MPFVEKVDEHGKVKVISEDFLHDGIVRTDMI